MITKQSVIGIVGLGVLGGSYAQALCSAGYESIIGFDIDSEALQYALEKGWIQEGTGDPERASECDLLIFCLYPGVFVKWIREHRNSLKHGVLITDVTGVKRAVLNQIEEELPENAEFIACHPMAGRESKGIRFADAGRFQNANFIIVPTDKNTPEAIETMRQLAQDMGFRRIACLSAEEHDRMISFLSQLTHVIAVSLMNANDNTNLAEYTGDSFRDLTRIARINEDMWPELFVLNKDFLIQDIDDFIREMESFREMIQNGDTDGMKQKMILSTERRKMFDGEGTK